jgi:hypothetical protein
MGNCNGLFSKCTDEGGLQKVDQHMVRAAVEHNNKIKSYSNAGYNSNSFYNNQNGHVEVKKST